jgi:protein-tyrosine phosphatase
MKEETKKIVFVCTGNTCRSPMAEALFRSEIKRLRLMNVEALSAGLSVAKGDGLNPYSAITLAQNGLSLENFQSTQLTDEILNDAYAIVCMTEKQRLALVDRQARLYGEKASEKIYSFYTFCGYEIPDPFGRELDCYRIVFDRISEAIPKILAMLKLTQEKTGEIKPDIETAVKQEKKSTPKKRGRPRKNPETSNTATGTTPKKRGRPKKQNSPNGVNK